ncbi:biotin/lipoyl-containing protein, partial [Streptomyces hygroscopicus]|uniref:biotin/lipoyl-containing protein n=1 Tax=Streptomyces hygroscopicus TaxID=1912 RepID=UPI00378C46E2
FHRAVVTDPAFTSDPFTIHTRWIETEFHNTIAPFTPAGTDEAEEPTARETVVVEVGGKRLEISLPAVLGLAVSPGETAGTRKPKRKAVKKSGSAASGDALASPMQGTIVKVAVAEGDTVAEGDLIVVLEAMKMEQPLNAHRAGTVKGLTAEVGASITSGAVICEIKD